MQKQKQAVVIKVVKFLSYNLLNVTSTDGSTLVSKIFAVTWHLGFDCWSLVEETLLKNSLRNTKINCNFSAGFVQEWNSFWDN